MDIHCLIIFRAFNCSASDVLASSDRCTLPISGCSYGRILDYPSAINDHVLLPKSISHLPKKPLGHAVGRGGALHKHPH